MQGQHGIRRSYLVEPAGHRTVPRVLLPEGASKENIARGEGGKMALPADAAAARAGALGVFLQCSPTVLWTTSSSAR